LPKSDNPGRIAENMDVYGFEIEEADMERLDDLDQGDAGAIGESFFGGEAEDSLVFLQL
jgi:diketogulonate reductase-like aldo/keto reductase